MKKVLAIPAAIVVVILVAFATTNAYRVPTVEISFVEERPSTIERAELTVVGLTCRGKSMLCAGQISDVAGVVSLTTYVRTHTAVVEYDPTATDLETIKNALCAPIVQRGQSYRAFSIEE